MSDNKRSIKSLDEISKTILTFIIVSGKPLKKTEIEAFFKQAHKYIYRSANKYSTKYKVNSALLASSLQNLVRDGYLGMLKK